MSDPSESIRRAFAAHTTPGRILGADTNFFEAGLTSANLARVAAELAANGTDVTLVDLFRHPTLRALTEELATRSGRPARPTAQLPWQR